jgi:hypothetical protein
MDNRRNMPVGKSASQKRPDTYLDQAFSLNNLRPRIERESIAKAEEGEKVGSERETVTPPGEMGVLILGDSGYTRQDERGGLEQSTGLAGVSGLPTRNRRAGQKAEAVGSAEARKPKTDLLRLWAEASRSL